jgi:hypothetical protein
MRTYYVGMHVHRASITMVVLNGAGKVVERLTVETSAARVRGYSEAAAGEGVGPAH